MASKPFHYQVKVSCLPYQPAGDQLFSLVSNVIKRNLADYFGNQPGYATDDYLISHGRNTSGTYYFDVYFANRIHAIIFKLTY